MTLEERVARGAALLNGEEPGWWKKINLKKLNIESKRNCILGQLFNGYGAAILDHQDWLLGETKIGGDHRAIHGFTGNYDYKIEGLTRAWAKLINERRENEPDDD